MPFRNDFCCGYASYLYCYDGIHNTNRKNSAPLKKVDRNDIGILSTKCEKPNKEAGKVKAVQESKLYFFVFPIKIIFFVIWLFLTLLLFVFSAVNAMLFVSGLL